MPTSKASFRRRLPALAACVLVFTTAATPPLLAQPAGASAQCDLLAASPSDASRPAETPGVEIGRIDAPAAIPACRKAVAIEPKNARLHYQLARALDAAKSPKAAEAYAAAEALDHPLAANNLGVLYLYGRLEGPTQDVDRAMALFRRSAALGSGVGAFNLGVQHRDGTLIPPDRVEALRWFQTAADLGHPEAHRAAALMLETEAEGRPADHEAAAAHWRALADAADPEALARVGIAIEEKRIAPLSPTEMTDRLSAAAAAGRPDAMLALGRHHLAGEGPEQAALAAEQAWRAFQIFAATPIDEEFGWLMYQSNAAILLQRSIARGAGFPGTSEEHAALVRDFGLDQQRKRFMATALCGEIEHPLHFYIWTWGRDYPQTDPQAEWLREARGCALKPDVVEAFGKIFAIARENNVNWPDLAAYALEAAATEAAAPASTAAPAAAPASAPQSLAALGAPGTNGPHSLVQGASRSFENAPSDEYRFITYRVTVPAGSIGILGLTRLEGAGKMGLEIGSGVEPGDFRRARISGRVHADSTSDGSIFAMIEPSGAARTYVVEAYMRDDLSSSWRIRFESFDVLGEVGEAFLRASLRSMARVTLCELFGCSSAAPASGQNIDRALSTLFALAGERDICGVGANLFMQELEREIRRDLGSDNFLITWTMEVATNFVSRAAWASCPVR